jgi:hypothetical protein
MSTSSNTSTDLLLEARVWSLLFARELERERQGLKNDWHEAAIQLRAILGVLLNK